MEEAEAKEKAEQEDVNSLFSSLPSEFDDSSGEAMERLLQCISQAAPLFSDKVII